MPEYRALILDLDGTLIGPDERISPRVAEAVRGGCGANRGLDSYWQGDARRFEVRR